MQTLIKGYPNSKAMQEFVLMKGGDAFRWVYEVSVQWLRMHPTTRLLLLLSQLNT